MKETIALLQFFYVLSEDGEKTSGEVRMTCTCSKYRPGFPTKHAK